MKIFNSVLGARRLRRGTTFFTVLLAIQFEPADLGATARAVNCSGQGQRGTALRARCRDVRWIDHRSRLRRYAHRHHQSGDRRRGGRSASGDSRRRQEGGDGQPDRGGADQRRQLDIVVEPGVTTLEQHLQTLFPGENIAVSVSEEAIILSGQVSSTTVMLRAGEIATASSSKAKIINMLQVPGGSESQQVMLQVRFAEVNRKGAHRARRESVRQSRTVRCQIDNPAILGA